MKKEDKFINSFIASIIGNIPRYILVTIPHWIWSIPKYTFWDYSILISIGHLPNKFTEYLLAITLDIGFGVGVGMIVCHGLNFYNTKHYLLAGGFLGGMVWFFIRATVYLFKMGQITHTDVLTAVINYSASILFGIVVAYVHRYLDRRSN